VRSPVFRAVFLAQLATGLTARSLQVVSSSSPACARQGDVLGGSAQPGSYCVEVFDVGNVQTTATYSVQVAHP
jgi:hypothetical protein